LNAPSQQDVAGQFAASLFVVHSAIALHIADGEFEKASGCADALAAALHRLLAIEKAQAGKASNNNRPRP
jgi:hypothetical protein